MLKEITISSDKKRQFIDITEQILSFIHKNRVKDGICFVYTPHTTAAITINENADPSVSKDILNGLQKIAPTFDNYSHAEGNSDAHIQSTIVGTSQCFFIENFQPKLGTWQGIFFCEFDGPRKRKILIKIAS